MTVAHLRVRATCPHCGAEMTRVDRDLFGVMYATWKCNRVTERYGPEGPYDHRCYGDVQVPLEWIGEQCK